MGARGFEYTIEAKTMEEFNKEFQSLAEVDRYENGHECYRGDIGQKHSFIMLSNEPVTLARLAELEHENQGDKWGPAMAVPVKDTRPVGKPRFEQVQGHGNHRWVAYDNAIKPFEVGQVDIKQISLKKLREPKYKLVPSGEVAGWYVTGCGQNKPFETKTEAKKVYKETLLKTGHSSLIYKDNRYTRVLTHEAMWEFQIEIQEFECAEEISHFKIWGWAAE